MAHFGRASESANRPRIQQLIEIAAKVMIATALVAGGLAGLALLGVAWFGPAFTSWASARNTPGTWLVLAFGIWPLLGVAYILGEGLFECLAKVLVGRRAGPARPDNPDGADGPKSPERGHHADRR